MKHAVLPFLLIAAGVTVLLTLFLSGGIFSLWQHRFADALYGGAEPLKNIVIVAVDDKSLQEIGRWPWSRHQYAALLHQLNNSKIVAFDISFFEPSSEVEDEALGRAMSTAGNVIIPQEAIKFEQRDGMLTAREWLKPITALENVTPGIVNIFTDADGVSRAIPASVDGIPSLAFVAAEKFIGSRPDYTEQRMLVNFIGRPGSFAVHSFTDVINQRVPEDAFENKIVFVGATAPDLHDDYLVPTSWGRRMPGVEIHAHALQTIITKRHVAHQSFFSTAAIIALLSFITALLFCHYSHGKAAIILSLALFAGVFAAALFAYNYGVLLNLVHQPLAVLITGVLCIAHIARSEASHKKHILGVFGRYVSKDVVEHLLANEEALELGGQEREISVLFVDIRGFTAISEKLTPHQVIEFLNHYFGAMTDIVFKNNGTLDKFIGDSIMAVFNSPHEEKEHAYKAVKTAVEMIKVCKALRKEGLPKVEIGIGVNTGKAVIGNMGSPQRQEFTALGDTVNTSSRFCGVAEPGQIIISEATYKQCAEKIIANKLPPLTVKGKEKPLIVYEVTGLKK